jgi:molybdopterin-guanine dinucleotide biosynthesis protein
MFNSEKLILIGGNSRNIGKTTIATGIISILSKQYRVIGLKVTSVYPNDSKHHGEKDFVLKDDVLVMEEQNRDGVKDTSRMIRAGAEKVYFIMVKDHALDSIKEHICRIMNDDVIVVCESLSLRKVVKPKEFILVRHPEINNKEQFNSLLHLADELIESDGKNPENLERFLEKYRSKKSL